jgi:hypothetical protein
MIDARGIRAPNGRTEVCTLHQYEQSSNVSEQYYLVVRTNIANLCSSASMSLMQKLMNSRRGFASMAPEKRSRIASLGGKAAHAQGTAHRFTHAEAVLGGKKSHRFTTPTADAGAPGRLARDRLSHAHVPDQK